MKKSDETTPPAASISSSDPPVTLVENLFSRLTLTCLDINKKDISSDLHRRLVLMAGSSFLGVVFFSLLAVAACKRGEVYLSVVESGYIAFLVINFIHARFFKRYESNIVASTLVSGLLFMYLYIDGGIENTGSLGCFIFPPIAIFLLGTRMGMIFSLLLLVPVVSLAGVDIQHPQIAGYSPDFVVRFILAYLMVTGVAFLFEQNAQRYRQEIQQINAGLEEVVAERTADLITLRDQLYREIEEHKRAKESLTESEERYRVMFEKSANGIFLVDGQDGRFIDANPAAEQLSGRSLEELQQSYFADVISVPGVEQLKKLQHPNGAVHLSEVEFIQKNGEKRPALMTAATIYGSVAVAIAYDISALKESEAEREQLALQLQNSQKMESIGTLAGGIAHDFNNILSAVMGYTELCRLKLDPDHPLQGHLDQIKIASWRAKELVQQILTFGSRKSQEQLKPLSIAKLVEETMRLVEATLPATIRISKTLDYSCKVMGDAVQVNQLVMNLCTNAAHAIGEQKGEIEVVLAFRNRGEMPLYRLSDGARHEAMVMLSVSDTGCGMSQDLITRVFDPFYTTKEVGVGTGMGLSVVHGIVKDMSGRIFTHSEVGQGSRFEIWLPAIEDDVNDEHGAPQKLPGGSEHIVYVDDEPFLVEIGEEVLSSLGYRVSGFEDPVAALSFIVEQADGIDLIITDNIMPVMTGTDLSEKVREQLPEMPIILCSGKITESEKERSKAAGVERILMKPLLIETLAPLVREVLDGHQESGTAT